MSGAWKALPEGADVAIAQGGTYAATASVSSSMTKAKLEAALAKYFPGVTLLSYVEQGESGGPPADPDASRKTVAAIVRSDSFTGTLAWSKGIVLVAPNLYTLGSAWVLTPPGGALPDAAPWAGALPARRAWNPTGVLLGGLAVVAAGSFAVYHWRKEIAEAIARSS